MLYDPDEQWAVAMNTLLRYEGFKAFGLDSVGRIVVVESSLWKRLLWKSMWWRRRRLWRSVNGWNRWDWRQLIIAAWHGG